MIQNWKEKESRIFLEFWSFKKTTSKENNTGIKALVSYFIIVCKLSKSHAMFTPGSETCVQAVASNEMSM